MTDITSSLSEPERDSRDFVADLLLDIGISNSEILEPFGFEEFLNQNGDSEFFAPDFDFLKARAESLTALLTDASEPERGKLRVVLLYVRLRIEWYEAKRPSWQFVEIVWRLSTISLTRAAVAGGSAATEAATTYTAVQRERAKKRNAPFTHSRQFCISRAADIWADEPPKKRLGEVVEQLMDEMYRHNQESTEGASYYIPVSEKIRKWLKTAQKKGDLNIPPEASKPGRPTSG